MLYIVTLYNSGFNSDFWGISCLYLVWFLVPALILSQLCVQELCLLDVVISVEVQSSQVLQSWHCFSCSCQSVNLLDINSAVCPDSYLDRVFSELHRLISFHTTIIPSRHFLHSVNLFPFFLSNIHLFWKEHAVKSTVSAQPQCCIQTWKTFLLLLHICMFCIASLDVSAWQSVILTLLLMRDTSSCAGFMVGRMDLVLKTSIILMQEECHSTAE